ncbi:hypothetical protein ASG17_04160 [Brevundimonas sp. Leaf363]|uniref:DUF3298 and DUF4163 domain-containing protein n=1 Tax=Brevundimonas sp. Leaf363 TaxID=1736353 RepID=UPI0006F9DF8B|nr:DUF3298 and DUF4163 domain-containing protein [Brevundimonas sp. Leaf363]KQS55295.1 hypothetical protein ASG17_04160 [Brevundimonas sp. Leaf363]
MIRSVAAPAIVVLLTLAALAGCKRKEDAQPPVPAAAPAPAVTPADAAAPLKYESKNQYAEVALTLPEAVKGQPDLHARLYAAAVRDLRQFTEGAQADRSEFGDDSGIPAYSKDVDLTTAAETGKLLSLRQTSYEFTGGAHPNTTYGSVLWDKALKRDVTAATLFRTGADMSALDRYLCEAINRAKKVRGSDEPVTLGDGDSGFSCPKAAATAFVLAPSKTPGKAGGLTFLINPYQVAAYAVGPFEITLPHSVFHGLLNPAYADEFAGEPVKVGDTTPMN